jgi:hypothetical protein
MDETNNMQTSATTPTTVPVPPARTETPEQFLDERRKFWSFFTGMLTFGVIAVAVILILMALFLV